MLHSTTTTIFKTMDFNTMWQLLYDHGASAKKEEGTRRFWANYRGCVIPQGVQVFSAKYNGVWVMYTRDDIEKFHLRVFNTTITGSSPDIQTT